MSFKLKTDFPMIVAILLSILGAVASFYLNFLSSDDIRPKDLSQSEWKVVQTEIKFISSELKHLKNSIEGAESLEALELATRIESVEKAQESLNALFLNEKQAAITLPLIKGEMDQQAAKIEFFSNELNSLNSSVQWLIALVFTSFAALVGVIATMLLRESGANK